MWPEHKTILVIYSGSHKPMEYNNDFKTKNKALNSPMNMRHNNCAVDIMTRTQFT